MLSRPVLTAAAVALAAVVGAADPLPAAPPEVPDPVVRIVEGGEIAPGRYRIGIEIGLPPDWHTYWRNPGDSGIPPHLDAAGSVNLDRLDPSFPAPERYFDGYGTSLVYHGGVVLPVEVIAADLSAPVDLSLAIDFGYCREICVPGRAELSGLLHPGMAAGSGSERLDDAVERVPDPEASALPGAPRLIAVVREGDDAKTARLLLTVAADGPVDLFAEPPEGWYLAVPEAIGSVGDRHTFALPLDGAAKGEPLAGAAFRFTLVGPDAAVDVLRTLD